MEKIEELISGLLCDSYAKSLHEYERMEQMKDNKGLGITLQTGKKPAPRPQNKNNGVILI